MGYWVVRGGILEWANEGTPVVCSFPILFDASQDTPPLRPCQVWILSDPGQLTLDSILFTLQAQL